MSTDKSTNFPSEIPREIRVRFAPSPTGYLHIGGARTALYNYLFARKHNGKFILRIEDTDTDRSVPAFLSAIFYSLEWLGLEWDEGPKTVEDNLDAIQEIGEYGPYLQSRRTEIYQKALKELVGGGKVYECYCTPEELKKNREEAMNRGQDPGYDGRCRNLTRDEKEAFQKKGIMPAYRLRTPDTGMISFTDMVKGEIEIDLATIKDFVIFKSDGMPTYNFACMVDDMYMHISHVIRGDDHIYNTPKQLLLYRAFNVAEEEIPQFAHLPQVHGTDGKKLSKRTGAVSVEDYRMDGYLPEALKNYLALIGWSTEDSQQIFEGDELIQKFEIGRCSKSCGIFDIEKLKWMNGKYIRKMTPDDIAGSAFRWLEKAGLAETQCTIPDIVLKAIKTEQEKFELLSEIPGRIDFIVKDNIEYDEKSVNKRLKKEGVKEVLTDLLEIFKETEDFTAAVLEDRVRVYCEGKGLGAGKVFHPVRVAVSGTMKGPGVFEMLELIGKEKSVKRVEYALENLVE
ncbi:MAG: glutamate--tRNA ligase [Elusimicrobiota bacterium]